MKTAAYAAEVIATMDRETKSKRARKRMAELALQIGNYDDAAKLVWCEYLSKF